MKFCRLVRLKFYSIEAKGRVLGCDQQALSNLAIQIFIREEKISMKKLARYLAFLVSASFLSLLFITTIQFIKIRTINSSNGNIWKLVDRGNFKSEKIGGNGF